MKQTFLLFVLLVNLAVWGQTIKAPQTPPAAAVNKPPSIRIFCATPVSGNKPLFVVDGQVVNEKELSGLKPAWIEQIVVLKRDNAVALYGSMALNGVVVITTKKAKRIAVNVADAADSTPLPSATIVLQQRGKTVSIAANEQGIAKLPPALYSDSIEISCTGYFSMRQAVGEVLQRPVFLRRNPRAMDTVTVRGTQPIICRRCGGCWVRAVRIDRYKDAVNGNAVNPDLLLYPNPLRGGMLTVALPHENFAHYRIVNAGGQVVKAASLPQQKVHRLSATGLLPGAYLVQVFSSDGHRPLSQKLLLH